MGLRAGNHPDPFSSALLLRLRFRAKPNVITRKGSSPKELMTASCHWDSSCFVGSETVYVYCVLGPLGLFR